MTKVQEKSWSYIYDLMGVKQSFTFNKLCMHICDGIDKGEYTNLECIDIVNYIKRFNTIPTFVDARKSRYSHLI